jgi:nucleotide-binding universal stress UspA family protein
MSRNPVVIGVKEEQPTALRFAAEAALARGVDLHVIHCVEPLIAGDIVLPVDDSGQTAGQEILDSAKTVLDSLDSPPAATYELSIGTSVGILGDAADKASLLVLGTDEDDWGDRLFTDKVTERVAKHAHVPVAIVPEYSRTHHVGTGVYVALDGRSPATGPL